MPDFARSAAYRVAILYSGAFALAIIALGLVLHLSLHRALLDQLDTRVTNEAAELSTEFEKDGRAGLTQAIADREQAGLANQLGYALFDASGRRIAGHLDTDLPAPGIGDIVFNDPQEGPDPARAATRVLGPGLTVVVAADREAVEQVDSTFIYLLLIALGVVLAMALAGGLILGAYLRKRLGRISGTARAIMAGDMTRRMSLDGSGDEFDQLSATLNGMLDRIAALLDNLRRVSSDIAHDLRTPLSRLHGRLESALAGAQDAASLRSAIDDALRGTHELLTIFSAILRISEIEARGLKRSLAAFDFSELVEELCQSFGPAIEDGGRSLHWFVEPGVSLEGDRELLAQAVVNLLENAQKHTPPGSQVSVKLHACDDFVELTVADNGPGVSDRDRDRITDRFVRLEAARTSAGHGLGLSLVRAIGDLHEAGLQFADNRPGLRVSMRFPGRRPA